ncbi:MAG: hypothetical protein ACUVRJ_10620 [Candidatus Villigracilaceae bacterium]
MFERLFPFLKRLQKETTSKALCYRLRDGFLGCRFTFVAVAGSTGI